LKKPGRFREHYYRIEGRGTAAHPLVPDGITELRIHGVSGAPPEDLVNDPHPLFVSGDDKAGFYRRLEPPEIGPDRTVEAYSWSAFNSRSRSRAFWLLLFPFAMVNHAGWMVGPKNDGTLERGIIRVLGLILTVHYALWAMVIFVDLLAYQCGRSEICRGRYLLGWFNSIRDFIGPSVIRQVVVFSALPVLVILLLLWTGRGDPSNYERWEEQGRGGGPPDGDGSSEGGGPAAGGPDLVDATPLRDPRFWQAPDSTRLLARSHGIAALSVVAATLAGIVDYLSGGVMSGFRNLELGLWALAGVAVLLALGAGRAGHGPQGTILWRRAIQATGLAAWLAIGTLLWLAWDAPVREGALPATLDVLRNSFDAVLLAEFGLLMLYFARDQIRMFVAIPLIGSALFWALNRPERAPVEVFEALPGRLWHHWLAIGLLVALAGPAVYAVRNRLTRSALKEDGRLEPDDSERHLSNQFWISFGLAPVFLATVLSVRAASSAAGRVWAGLVGAGICVLYLMLTARIQIRRAHDYAPRWKLRVGGPGTLAAVGATALTLVSAAVIVFSAQRLGSAVPVGRQAGSESAGMNAAGEADPGEAPIGYYDELGWIAAAGLGSLMVFALALQTRIAGLWRFRFKDEVPKIRAELDGLDDLPARHRKGLPRRMAKARTYSCLLDDLDWMVTVGIVAFMACSLSVIAGQYLGRSAEGLDRLVGFASWLLVSIAFLAIWVVRGAQKDSGLRRAIGTLWEVTGFFPRRFHPLAPPSYGERAVPELRSRLLLLTEGSREVLLLAHSQGTLLCNAVLQSLLGEPTRKRLSRIRFITYGCMLQRSYGRSFPHLVRSADLIELKAVLEGAEDSSITDFPEPVATDREGEPLPGWMNFGRNTDFLGGRMFVVPHRPPGCKPEDDRVDDVLFDDPPVLQDLPAAGGEPFLWGHSFNYLDGREDPRFLEQVQRVLRVMAATSPRRR